MPEEDGPQQGLWSGRKRLCGRWVLQTGSGQSVSPETGGSPQPVRPVEPTVPTPAAPVSSGRQQLPATPPVQHSPRLAFQDRGKRCAILDGEKKAVCPVYPAIRRLSAKGRSSSLNLRNAIRRLLQFTGISDTGRRRRGHEGFGRWNFRDTKKVVPP